MTLFLPLPCRKSIKYRVGPIISIPIYNIGGVLMKGIFGFLKRKKKEAK